MFVPIKQKGCHWRPFAHEVRLCLGMKAWSLGLAAFEIAQSAETRIRVLAGPGAGKSFAMKRRVARLLEDEGVHPDQLLPVTFTRVAAEDLHRELVSLQVAGANQLKGGLYTA